MGQHKLPASIEWWDNFVIPEEHMARANSYLHSNCPEALEHDYVIYTDGSGCKKGWGGNAAVIERVDVVDGYRAVASVDYVVSANYGQTVNRNEFSALLDGVHHALSDAVNRNKSEQQDSFTEVELYEIAASGGWVNTVTGRNRIRICWYTDRKSLASCFLYDADNSPVNARSNCKDLWMRWSYYAKHVCLTPRFLPRNVIPMQEVADNVAGLSRASLKELEKIFVDKIESKTKHNLECNKQKNQKEVL